MKSWSSFKTLIVGDPHVVPEELDDCCALLQLILKVCRVEEINEVWWTGDQHHTHNVLRLEVLNWWLAAFKALKNEGINSVCLVGNHDQAGPGSEINAMMAYRGVDGLKVVYAPTEHRGVLMVPYMDDEEQFQRACRDAIKVDEEEQITYGPETVFCHQTFDGSTYENGFLASDGFDSRRVPQELIISGHIHTGQEFGKVWYVGAPRWRSLSDANVERSIWVVEFKDGRLVNRKPFSTGDSCRQIKQLEDTPETPVALPLESRHQYRIDIKGPPDWCQRRKKELQAAGARIRTFPTQTSSTGKVRESEGIAKAFRAFLGAYQAKYGTSTGILEAMVKERLNV